jgi:hypothetical protein
VARMGWGLLIESAPYHTRPFKQFKRSQQWERR